ncbi:MAG: transglycosylase SLT domain-containing protein [Pseudomonadota bacterium]
MGIIVSRNLLRCLAILFALAWALVAGGCATKPPENVENICAIFEEKGGWYKAAKKSEKRWGTPKHVQMAIIRQESSFDFNARPPRTKLLGIVPWKRPSNAYGYAQALDSTWNWYRKDTGRRSADRDDFDDAIDFVGWYTHKSHKVAGISKWDPYNQYLAYHEGQGGFKKGTYRRKGWLKDTARKVDYRAKEWGAQLKRCESDLDSGGWWIFGS